MGINVDAMHEDVKDPKTAVTAVRRFLVSENVAWTNVLNRTGANDLTTAYGVEDIPANFLIGRDGKIIALELSGDGLYRSVSQALAKRGRECGQITNGDGQTRPGDTRSSMKRTPRHTILTASRRLRPPRAGSRLAGAQAMTVRLLVRRFAAFVASCAVVGAGHLQAQVGQFGGYGTSPYQYGAGTYGGYGTSPYQYCYGTYQGDTNTPYYGSGYSVANGQVESGFQAADRLFRPPTSSLMPQTTAPTSAPL